MIATYRDRMRARLDAERAAIAEHVVSGAATNWDNYRERVGRAKGLMLARELLDEVYQEMQSDDDD